MGKRVHQGDPLVVTNGSQGPNDPSFDRDELIRLREREQQEAAEVLGIGDIVFLRYEDGSVQDTDRLRCDMTKQILSTSPTLSWTRTPPSTTSKTSTSTIPTTERWGRRSSQRSTRVSARCRFTAPSCTTRAHEPHQIMAYMLVLPPDRDFFADIGAYLDKVSAPKAHHWQTGAWECLEDFIEGMASTVAARSGQGIAHAEAFKVLRFDSRSFSTS